MLRTIAAFIFLAFFALTGCIKRCSSCTKYYMSPYHIDTSIVGGVLVFDTVSQTNVVPNSTYGTCMPPPMDTSKFPPHYGLYPDTFIMCISDEIR